MICLGIESTAHTFGVGIVNSKKEILANEKISYTTESGGMIPAKTAEHHVKICDKVLLAALKKAKIDISDIDVISFSQAPGLGHMLRVGATMARSLKLLTKKPLIGVNHCIAHLEIGRMFFDMKDPVMLYASGANTQIIAYDSGKYRIFGETLDNGAGNFLDSFARELGLGFPGGPKIYDLSLKGKKLIKLPYVVKGMDVSFGGLLTNLKNKIKTKEYKKEDLAYSAQETIFAMLLEVSERAMAHTGKSELLLGGGVACNVRLQEMARQMCKERKAKCYIPKNEFLVDNAAMIAWLGLEMHKKNKKGIPMSKTHIKPYERTDEIDVNWR